MSDDAGRCPPPATQPAAKASARRREAAAVSPVQRAARLVAASMRVGGSPANATFDRFLSEELRSVSEQYWTPLPVVRRAAAWLAAARVRTVVDIGSGAGKFCVATALLAPCRFIGLEQRASLVTSARELAALFGVDDRVTFVNGAFGLAPTPVGDCYYLFNPFGDYAFESPRYADAVESSEETYKRDVYAVVRFLSRAPFGTFVLTYNGFGGQLPPSYEQVRVDLSFPRALRLWRKRRPASRRRTSLRLHLSISEPFDDPEGQEEG